MGLHTMLCLSSLLSTRRRSFSCASMSSSSVMSSVPDPMMMSSTKGSAQSRTGPSSRSSIMRWKAALPLLAPKGTTFHCMGPSGLDIAVQGVESGCSGIC